MHPPDACMHPPPQVRELGMHPPPQWQPQSAAEQARWAALDLRWIRCYDYTACRARLLGAVPGRHTGEKLGRWGHMQVRGLRAEGMLIAC
jgi:hypothetical protein